MFNSVAQTSWKLCFLQDLVYSDLLSLLKLIFGATGDVAKSFH